MAKWFTSYILGSYLMPELLNFFLPRSIDCSICCLTKICKVIDFQLYLFRFVENVTLLHIFNFWISFLSVSILTYWFITSYLFCVLIYCIHVYMLFWLRSILSCFPLLLVMDTFWLQVFYALIGKISADLFYSQEWEAIHTYTSHFGGLEW